MTASYKDLMQEVLIDEQTLQTRIAELGAQISHDYAGLKRVLFVCVLKGGVMFLTDLTRHIDVPHAIDFMAVSSYGSHARETTGVVRIDMDLRQDVQGTHLVLVEDIVDSGHTLAYLRGLLLARQPASLKICSLLSKPDRRKVDVQIDYLGFNIPDKFVFGYGLDLDELYRNLPFVAVVRAGATSES